MNTIIEFFGKVITTIIGMYFLFIFVMFLIIMVILENYDLLHYVNDWSNTL